ncbi:nuclear transport factor 2 family protein [Aurantiacibacter xanthus]|uniref:nuclear transport factor 2 family protein n=1 Tax=Aurantiacibacter xanthus TaxID=1784712 RepID=UPI001FECCEDF|nr:nuclear transport factor 2 family protein [Aurantiacibacter xanthus]
MANETLEREIAALRTEVRRLSAWTDIANLQAAYGYYVDKALYDEAADLFARDATLEIAGRGLFRGQDRIRTYLNALPPMEYGGVFNHMQLQPVITVSEDGLTAKARWRAFIQIGWLGREARWAEGTYENRYVFEDDRWKIDRLHFFTTYYVEYDKGWNEGGVELAKPLDGVEPDETVTVAYGAFPHVYVPPFHYANPVSGREWTEERSRQLSTLTGK